MQRFDAAFVAAVDLSVAIELRISESLGSARVSRVGISCIKTDVFFVLRVVCIIFAGVNRKNESL